MADGNLTATEEILRELYYDTATGYLSAYKFYKRLRSIGYHITLARVSRFIKEQGTAQVSVVPPKEKVFNTIVAAETGHKYQMDTMFLLKHEYNGFKYVLLVIDVHSRYLGAAPMKEKNDYYTKGVFRDIIDHQMVKTAGDGVGTPVWPKSLACDLEYKKISWVEDLEMRGVELWYSQRDQPHKNAVVESVIKTLRTFMKRWRFQTGDPDWPSSLPTIVGNYNNTYHRTIKATPDSVWNGEDTNKQDQKWLPRKRKVGDRVRYIIRKVKASKFRKSDKRQVSKNIYVVVAPVPRQGYSWYIALEREEGYNYTDDDILMGKDDKFIKFLDHELIPVDHSHGNPRTEAEAENNEVTNIVRRAVARDLGEAGQIVPFQELPVIQRRKRKEKEKEPEEQPPLRRQRNEEREKEPELPGERIPETTAPTTAVGLLRRRLEQRRTPPINQAQLQYLYETLVPDEEITQNRFLALREQYYQAYKNPREGDVAFRRAVKRAVQAANKS